MSKGYRNTLWHHINDLTPNLKCTIIGSGQAFDPLPFRRRYTFVKTDSLALFNDWSVVGSTLEQSLSHFNPTTAPTGDRYGGEGRQINQSQEAWGGNGLTKII